MTADPTETTTTETTTTDTTTSEPTEAMAAEGVPREHLLEAIAGRDRAKRKAREYEARLAEIDANAEAKTAERQAWEAEAKAAWQQEKGVEPADDWDAFLAQRQEHNAADVEHMQAELARWDVIERNREVARTWARSTWSEAPSAEAIDQLAAIIVDHVQLDASHESEAALRLLSLEDLVRQ